MNAKLQPVRGTHDLLPEEWRQFRHVTETAYRIGGHYGFQGCATPIFEFTQVYQRTLGETSDVVNKEMYSFDDRGGENITLRPEFTAGIARAVISNGLQQHLPLKLFSTGPLFRYERPQKGRQRQFHQINFEYLGVKEPQADVEMIALGYDMLKALKISGEILLELNSLGDQESRAAHREALVAYLSQYKSDLSEDSQRRLEKNPLRILDSKDAKDREIVAGAPQMAEYFTEEANAFFDQVKAGLDALGIPYKHNSSIVRGLDYYNHTVFEFVVQSDELGAQNTILAGGRYDSLIQQMGGVDVPAVGFAAGVERLLLLAGDVPVTDSPVAVIALGDEAMLPALQAIRDIRRQAIPAEMIYGGNNMGKRMKKADKLNASIAVIIAEDEVKDNTVTIRDLKTGEQQTVAAGKLADVIKQIY